MSGVILSPELMGGIFQMSHSNVEDRIFQMSPNSVRDRKLLVLFDFYMDLEFGQGPEAKCGCPYSLSEEFAVCDCSGLCNSFFPRCRANSKCPCHAYARPVAELHNLLKKEGYVDV